MALTAISEIQHTWIIEVTNSYATDREAQHLLTESAITSPNTQNYSLSNGIIRHNDKIVIGQNSAFRTKMITAMHASALGDHSSTQVTYQ